MKSSPISYSDKRRRRMLLLAALCAAAAALLSLVLGAVRLSPARLWEAICTGDRRSATGRILFYSRLPRTAACLAAGAGLSVSGCILQGVLANPLAAPNIIGVNAGAGLAVTLCCVVSASGWAVSGAAFLGALGAVALVAALARATGASRLTVVLSGVAVNALLNAVSETLRSFFPDAAMNSVDFRVGGFSGVTGSIGRLWPATAAIAAGVALAFLLANELDVLSMGEETAHGVGLSVGRCRALLLGVAALLAGASVSFCGLLGFVGLIVPHLCRQLIGSDSRWMIPMCALTGGALVTVCDLVGRTVCAPYELPAGIFLAFLGAPFFLFLLIRQRGGRTHA